MPDGDVGAAAFLDANVLVYAFTEDSRSAEAKRLLAAGCVISVQGLNEFANVASRKLRRTWPEIADALSAIRVACSRIVPLDIDVHEAGMTIAARYRLSVCDGLMLAAARKTGCSTFWSEDLQNGLAIEGSLTVRNPFAWRQKHALLVIPCSIDYTRRSVA